MEADKANTTGDWECFRIPAADIYVLVSSVKWNVREGPLILVWNFCGRTNIYGPLSQVSIKTY
jgi:hypothetical protein